MMQLTLGSNRSTMGENDVLGDREPQASATGLSRTGLIDTVEALEQAGQMLGRDAGAKVPDVKLDAVLRPSCAEHDLLSRSGVFQRIFDQI